MLPSAVQGRSLEKWHFELCSSTTVKHKGKESCSTTQGPQYFYGPDSSPRRSELTRSMGNSCLRFRKGSAPARCKSSHLNLAQLKRRCVQLLALGPVSCDRLRWKMRATTCNAVSPECSTRAFTSTPWASRRFNLVITCARCTSTSTKVSVHAINAAKISSSRPRRRVTSISQVTSWMLTTSPVASVSAVTSKRRWRMSAGLAPRAAIARGGTP
mmetsp:Transcript_30992/g.82353  ORF Transcript_30992/g.82353 Transcript_30992/m.82353 type:complete len:214 (-) Transcript_30992:170-811(-)